MDKAWKKYIDTATGLTELTRKGAEQVVRNLVKQGELAADQVERTVDDLLKRTEKNRKVVASIVRTEVERAVNRLGLAREQDVDRLRTKVSRMESSHSGDAATARTTAKKTTKKSAAARRAGTEKAASSSTRRSTSTAKKATAKKATAKKATAKKATAKKATAKKATAKRMPPPAAGTSGADQGDSS